MPPKKSVIPLILLLTKLLQACTGASPEAVPPATAPPEGNPSATAQAEAPVTYSLNQIVSVAGAEYWLPGSSTINTFPETETATYFVTNIYDAPVDETGKFDPNGGYTANALQLSLYEGDGPRSIDVLASGVTGLQRFAPTEDPNESDVCYGIDATLDIGIAGKPYRLGDEAPASGDVKATCMGGNLWSVPVLVAEEGEPYIRNETIQGGQPSQ